MRLIRDEIYEENPYFKIRERWIKKELHEEEETYKLKIDEKSLKVIWHNLNFERRNLKTVNGESVVIKTPGQWNTSEGPDFIDAEIKVGGNELKGDVEVHMRSSDWKNHNHDKDKKYDNIILHVFLIKTDKLEKIKTVSGRQVYELELSYYIDPKLLPTDVSEYPFISSVMLGECGRKLKSIKYEIVNSIINYAADTRLVLKSKQYDVSGDTERLLYEKICDALGYVANRLPMKRLTEVLPLKKLIEIKDKNKIIALIFGISGLLRQVLPEDTDETKKYLQSLNEIWEKDFNKLNRFKLNAALWCFKKVRPFNFPHRRLMALGQILEEIMDKKNIKNLILTWFQSVKSVIEKNNLKKDEIRQTLTFLPQHEITYFNYHARFGDNGFKRPIPLLGDEKKCEIVVNIFLPFLLYFGRRYEHNLIPFVFKYYSLIPLFTVNKTSKTMFCRLFGPERIKNLFLKKERYQQGLIQLFLDFCDTKLRCHSCVFPEVLEQL